MDMFKDKAVANLGKNSLLMPTWIKAALAANDRIKLCLSLLQAAEQHVRSPHLPSPNWRAEFSILNGEDLAWLKELCSSAYLSNDALHLKEYAKFIALLTEDIKVMSRPICDSGSQGNEAITLQRNLWLDELKKLSQEDGFRRDAIHKLTHGDRKIGGSFHILVMDLHKKINEISCAMSTENIDGAHVWQIESSDRPLIKAFMRGLNRTAPLKFTHPGLGTAVTRDGDKLLIQNDIGTNDVHVLVIEVVNQTIALTYSDLHKNRFDFFRNALEDHGYKWEVFDPIISDGLNEGKPYWVGNAKFHANSTSELEMKLDAVASRIVFVIDWNRARKRLQHFVSKPVAIEILRYSAQQNWGHMGWLIAGGEQLIYRALQAVDTEAFRIGERLDDILGERVARDLLLELLHISSEKLLQNLPVALIADEARMLVLKTLNQRTFEFELISEHASYCHALAQALCDLLEGQATHEVYGAKAKDWEHKADQILIEVRQKAERQLRWEPIANLLLAADDIADSLEEAIFIFQLTVTKPLSGLPTQVLNNMAALANTTLGAIQDQLKAIEIARNLSSEEPSDSDVLLQTLWQIIRAEQFCDNLLRECRVLVIKELHQKPIEYSLASDLANAIESASDSLLTSSYGLRQIVFSNTRHSI